MISVPNKGALGKKYKITPIMKAQFYLILLLMLLIVVPVYATWYGENVEKGADIMMMDIRWPWWPECTYFANWNFAMNPNGKISGYGGFTGGVPALKPDFVPNLDSEVQEAFRPGSVWSFWGSNAQGDPVRVIAASRFTYPSQYIGEGASGSLGGPVWPFIQQNHWYRMLMRVWMPLGQENAKYSYIGRWTKDLRGNRWYLYGIVRLPVKATSFRGNAGFLEDFAAAGRSLRSLHRRLGYYRKEGKWFKSDTVIYNVPPAGNSLDTYWYVNKINNGRVLAMELTSNPNLKPVLLSGKHLELGKKHSFTVEQPDLPVLDQPAIKNIQVKSNGRQVWVSWQVPPSASPQFAYKIEVFNNSACLGEPIAVREERMPIVRNVLLKAITRTPTVRISLTDIFDQTIKPVVVKAEIISNASKTAMVKTLPGLRYKLIFKDKERPINVFYPFCKTLSQNRNERHFWISLKELTNGRLVQQGICRGFDTSLRGNRQHGFAFRYRGILDIPTTGMYLFHIKGTDGYRINIDGNVALTWDALHGPEERSFMLNLAKGGHIIGLDYFFDKMKPFLQLQWEGPGFSRQSIPVSVLRHRFVSSEPQINLGVKSDDGQILFLKNGKIESQSAVSSPDTNKTGFISTLVSVQPNGHTIDKVELFLDDMKITDIAGNELNSSKRWGGLPDILLPAGEHRIWARVFCDGNYTFDSQFLPVKIGSGKVSDWSVGIAGELDSKHNIVQTAPDAFSFVGEGEYVIYRKIKGDFTLTCKVEKCLGLHGEPVNGTSWVGLSAREHADKNGYKWGRQFGLMQTARHGLRTTRDNPDLGGSRMSRQVLPKNRPWLRMVRQGNRWTAWGSRDGKTWDIAASHFIPASQQMGAGVVFRALPQDSQMYFRAAVSNVSLTPGLPKDWQNMKIVITPAVATQKVHMTGVVVAPSNPRIVVVRTSDRGLLRSDDAGKTWHPANGKLQGSANVVRSIAIHPDNPDIMFRAAGHVASIFGPSGTSGFTGGLYRTSNGGKSWKKLAFGGDFDGKGPSAICGEIIAFVPHQPETILVGCESRGLMRTKDGGKTWKQIIPPGERITAVKVNPYFRDKTGYARVHVVTCPDRFLPVLGRGKSAFTSKVKLARHYISYNDGKSFRRQSERDDLGYFNLSTNNRSIHTLIFATSQGILYSFDNGRSSYLLIHNLQLDSLRPFTAVAGVKPASNPWVRSMAQALNPAKPNRISRCDIDGTNWRWQSHNNNYPSAYIAIMPASILPNTTGNNWWIVGNDGLYYTNDCGATLKKVLK